MNTIIDGQLKQEYCIVTYYSANKLILDILLYYLYDS